jgi:hypothetical protein
MIKNLIPLQNDHLTHTNPKLYTQCPWTFNTLVDGTNYCNVFNSSQQIMKVAFFNVKIVTSTEPMNAHIKVNGLKPSHI